MEYSYRYCSSLPLRVTCAKLSDTLCSSVCL